MDLARGNRFAAVALRARRAGIAEQRDLVAESASRTVPRKLFGKFFSITASPAAG